MKCGDCINYGTCRGTCNVTRLSDICSSFLGKLSCNGCKYDNDRFSDICYHDCIMFSDYEKEYIGEPIVKDESISCGNCSNDEDGCRVACIRKEYFAPKENKMKPQMTEEEAGKIYDDGILEICATTKKCFISGMKEGGYIKKSEIETLVEEAGEMYKEHFNCNPLQVQDLRMCNEYLSRANKLIDEFYKTFQSLKSHLKEWGGER